MRVVLSDANASLTLCFLVWDIFDADALLIPVCLYSNLNTNDVSPVSRTELLKEDSVDFAESVVWRV